MGESKTLFHESHEEISNSLLGENLIDLFKLFSISKLKGVFSLAVRNYLLGPNPYRNTLSNAEAFAKENGFYFAPEVQQEIRMMYQLYRDYECSGEFFPKYLRGMNSHIDKLHEKYSLKKEVTEYKISLENLISFRDRVKKSSISSQLSKNP